MGYTELYNLLHNLDEDQLKIEPRLDYDYENHKYIHPIALNYFKEFRVAIVKTDLTKVNYQTCSDNDFLTEAENQGHTFTLNGFQRFLNSGEYVALTQELLSTEYLLVRFINMYQYEGEVYCDDRPLGDMGYERTY